MGMCKWFFRNAAKIQNGHQRATLKIFVCAKTLKLKVRNYLHFTITFPMIQRCAGDFFKVLRKFKMAATDQLKFFGGCKNSKNLCGRFFFNFNITFLATWGCASDFFKDATKFQYGRQRSTPKFVVGAKTTKLKKRNFSNFTITFPTIWRCASDFSKVLLKFKMAAMDKLHIFLWAQKLKNWNQ